MARKYNIRWKPDDNQELRKAVKNFNAKLSRIEKKNPTTIIIDNEGNAKVVKTSSLLPERVTVKEIKELIDTRQDLKRELASLKRFTQRGSEQIVKIPDTNNTVYATKWQKEEMIRRVAVNNRMRKQRYIDIADIPMTDRGQDLGYTRGDIGMGTVDENALKPMQAFTPSMEQHDLKSRFKAIRKESQGFYWAKKEKLLRDNVIKGIRANYETSLTKEVVDKIISAIEEMDFKDFYRTFQGESGVMEIVSPPPGADLDEIIEQNLEVLQSIWIPEYN